MFNIEPYLQRLVYSGKILSDESSLSDCDIKDGVTVILVASKKPAPATPQSVESKVQVSAPAALSQPPQPPAAPHQPMVAANPMDFQQQMQQQMMQNPELLASIMDSPLMQSMMDNPQIMQQMVMHNPQMQQVLNDNPELRHVLDDPEVIRQSLRLARNPNLMQEMMRNSDRALANIESMPGGYDALRRMYHNVQEPMMEAAMGIGQRGASTSTVEDANASPNAPQSATPVDEPLPNPWATPSTTARLPQQQQQQPPNMAAIQAMMQAMQRGQSNMNPAAVAVPRVVNMEASRQQYQQQLQALQSMGFPDADRNLEALIAVGGNIQAAIERLLNQRQ